MTSLETRTAFLAELGRVRGAVRHTLSDRVCNLPPGPSSSAQITEDLHGQRACFAKGPLSRQWRWYHQHVIVNHDPLAEGFQECHRLSKTIEICSACNIGGGSVLADRIRGRWRGPE